MSEVKRTKLGPVSAYAIAVKNGFEGTEKEWLESLAAGEYADMTEGFQAQSDYASPVEYLRSLGIGSWKVVDSGMLCMAKIVETGVGRVRFERRVTDDPFFYDEIFLNDRPVYAMSTEAGSISVSDKKMLTDHNVLFASDELGTGTVELPSVKKAQELACEAVGSPTAAKAGYIPVVSAKGSLELAAVSNAEEVAY